MSDHLLFTRSALTWQSSLLRLFIIFFPTAIPQEWNSWIMSKAFQSVLVDPAFSLDTFQEALAIRRLFSNPTRFVDTYRGHQIPIPPLFLAFMESFMNMIPSNFQRLFVGLLLLLIDFCIAWNLERMGRSILLRARPREEYLLSKMPDRIRPELGLFFGVHGRREKPSDCQFTIGHETIPFIIAQMYYWSPLSILSSSSSLCLQNVPILLLVLSVQMATNRVSGSVIWSAFWLSISSYLSAHNVIFAIPIALLWWQQNKSMQVFWMTFAFLSFFLQFLNMILVGEAEYWPVFVSTHGATFALSNLRPSLSTTWYLGMLLFARFSYYIAYALGVLPYVVIIPTTIRLYPYPEALIAIFWLLGTLARPPGTLYSLNIGLLLMLLSPHSLARMRFKPSLVALSALMVPVSLYLVNHWLWLESNVGEANFLFFQCLAYNVFVTILFLQFCSATLKRDKALRLTEKFLEGRCRDD